MAEPAYRQKIIDYIRAAAQPPDKFSHQPRLYALAVKIAGEQPFDDDVLFAAAWLHDIGVFIGHRPEDPALLAKWDNVAYAVKVIPALLHDFGFPDQKTPALVDAVRTHLPSGSPTTFEGTLLRDADILEQLGATGILRTVCKIGRDTRFQTFDQALTVIRKNSQELQSQLLLPSAKPLANDRIQLMEAFLAASAKEMST
jgi:uncharacterized protein